MCSTCSACWCSACSGLVQSIDHFQLFQQILDQHSLQNLCGTFIFLSSPKAFSNSHPNSFHGRMSKLNSKFHAELLHFLLSLTHHTLTEQRLAPHWLVQWSRHCSRMCIPGSLLTHVHSLASRLLQCHANHSRDFNNGWTFSGQTLCASSTFCSLLIYIISLRK